MSTERHFTAEAPLRLSSSRQWPGERHPDHTDVELGNQNPASNFLERFRAALLHSASVEVDEPPELDLRVLEHQMMQATASEQYTYPMALLSRVHSVPADEELARLLEIFASTFKHHILVKDLDLTANSRDNVPPYLQYACAALAAVFSSSGDQPTPQAMESANLFITGVHLWIVSLESDNREARLMEAVYAAILLATYGILCSDRTSWRKGRGLLCNIVVIVRRIHVTDGYSPIYNGSNAMERDINMKSSLLSYMLLVDALQTLHCNSVPNFSASELFVRMPTSNYAFRKLYDSLTHGYAALPADVNSREDGLLLLLALLNDVTYTQKSYLPYVRAQRNEFAIRRSFDSSAGVDSTNPGVPNPFAPLTSQSEYSRLTAMFHHALSRWEHHFRNRVGGDIMALCHFARIQLLCPDLNELPLQVNYARTPTTAMPSSPIPGTREIEVPDKAVDIAWQILDDLEDGGTSSEQMISIWLPIVVFMSALVVWKKLRWQKTQQYAQGGTAVQGGTMKVLSMFARQLALYTWPCCGEMIAVLERLARS